MKKLSVTNCSRNDRATSDIETLGFYPAHKFCLFDVRSKRGHQAYVRRILHKGLKRGFVLPR